MNRCPFCGRDVVWGVGHEGITFFYCGLDVQKNEVEGCGAIMSFRPPGAQYPTQYTPDEAAKLFSQRVPFGPGVN